MRKLLAVLALTLFAASASPQSTTAPSSPAPSPWSPLPCSEANTTFHPPCVGASTGLWPGWGGLVGYWDLDETNGVREDDYGGFDLIDNNTVGVSPYGPTGTVARLAFSAGERLDGPDYSALSGLPFTVAFWYNSTNAGDCILVTDRENVWGENEFAFEQAGWAGGFVMRSGSIFVGLPRPALNTWHYIVGTHDGAGNVTVYVDNVLAGATPGSVYSVLHVPHNFRVSDNTFGVDSYLVSRIGVWSREITAGERASLFNLGHGKPYADLTAGERVGLVSYHNVDEAAGDRLDSFGANTLTDVGTVMGEAAVPSAMHNAAALFVAANNEYLDSGAATPVDFSHDLSLSTWFNLRDVTGWRGMFGASVAPTFLIQCSPADPTQITVTIWTAGVPVNFGSTLGYSANAWHHLVMAWDVDTLTATLYVDGALDNAGVGVGAVPAADILLVGRHHGGALWDGSMDEVALWQDHTLTPAEVVLLYNGGAGRYYPN